VILTDDLSKQFGDFWAVDGVSLHVREGEVLALLGQNGAGKTTTIRMLTAIFRPTRGTAIVAGYDVVRDPSKVRSRVGVLTEHHGLYARMSAWEYLDFFGQVYGLDDSTREKRAKHLLDYFSLTDSAHKRIGEFSKGMRQKLSLARAILHEPPVLLLDEPTSAMDPESARLVRREIAALRSEHRAIVICTHNLAEAEKLADRVAMIYRGRILVSGTLDELREKVLGPPEYEVRFAESWGGELSSLPAGVEISRREDNALFLRIENPERANPSVLRKLISQDAPVLAFQEIPRSLEQVYLAVMAQAGGEMESVYA